MGQQFSTQTIRKEISLRTFTPLASPISPLLPRLRSSFRPQRIRKEISLRTFHPGHTCAIPLRQPGPLAKNAPKKSQKVTKSHTLGPQAGHLSSSSRPFASIAVKKHPKNSPKFAKNRHARISLRKNTPFCAKKSSKVIKSRHARSSSRLRFTGFVLLLPSASAKPPPGMRPQAVCSPPARKCPSHTPVPIRSAGTCLPGALRLEMPSAVPFRDSGRDVNGVRAMSATGYEWWAAQGGRRRASGRVQLTWLIQPLLPPSQFRGRPAGWARAKPTASRRSVPFGGGAGGVLPKSHPFPVPEGHFENSPRFQPWEPVHPSHLSPEGTTEVPASVSLPCLLASDHLGNTPPILPPGVRPSPGAATCDFPLGSRFVLGPVISLACCRRGRRRSGGSIGMR